MFYKLTAKINNRRYPTLGDYDTVIKKLEAKGMKLVEWYYEIDTISKLHLHGLCEARSNYYLKKVIDSFANTGTHIMLEKFKRNSEHDIGSWLKYIKKDQHLIDAQLRQYYTECVIPEESREVERTIIDSTDAFKKRLRLKMDL